ncbi:spore germination protein [Mesobacillus foraminis]|uniref:spore germination protein n=1 Tax=Mesobacillus foraminis TaxID=279826 RepID=UPI004058BFE6
MQMKFTRRKNAKTSDLHTDKTERVIDVELDQDIKILKELFKDCSDIVFRPFKAGQNKAYIIFVDGLIDTKSIQFHVLEALEEIKEELHSAKSVKEKMLSAGTVTETEKLDDLVKQVLSGNTGLMIDGLEKALVIDAKGGSRRSVAEPETETAIRGSREGFTESLRVNTSLVRHKIRSNRLKIIAKTVGEETQTNIAILYIDGLCAPELLKEVEKRIDRIKIDGILESGYIEELIEDNTWSLFPQIQNTERPDTVAANLLEGRVAVIVDGTPFSLILPATFWQFLQASEDYYHRFHISIFLRVLRVLFIFLALELPAIYVAVTTYHQEMIPTNLLFSVAASREAIPFPAFVEALIMEISFEALREAGIRLPKLVGQAVSILGALVIGQAAVEAGIVSAPMVIIVSMTGIASFTIPRFNMAISIRLLRFPIMILAGMFGLYGIVLGSLVILTHLCKLRSFGVPYFSPLGPLQFRELKDVFIRAPWWALEKRPTQTIQHDITRQKTHSKPRTPNEI